MRKTEFANGEYYHIYNRGVDKRVVFSDRNDFSRFFQSMAEFNTLQPIGSLYENSFNRKDKLGSSTSKSKDRLIEFVCFCLNPNHFHFLCKQVSNHGIEKFMHRLSTGYTKYFNQKHTRSGVLFQGRYKAIHVKSNEYLLHLSAYINLNFKVHDVSKGNCISSWAEYEQVNKSPFCFRDPILGQFNGRFEYRRFALQSLSGIRERKKLAREMESFLLE